MCCIFIFIPRYPCKNKYFKYSTSVKKSYIHTSSVNLKNGVIRTFETNRCTDKFKIMWKDKKEFAKNLNIALDISKSIFY